MIYMQEEKHVYVITHHREDINLTLGFTVPSNAIWFIVIHSNPAPIPAIGKHNQYKVQKYD